MQGGSEAFFGIDYVGERILQAAPVLRLKGSLSLRQALCGEEA